MCGLLQCGPAFDPNGLATGGYLYHWLQTVLNSPKERVSISGTPRWRLVYFAWVCSVDFTSPRDTFVFVARCLKRKTSSVCLSNSLFEFAVCAFEFWFEKTNRNRKAIIVKISAE